jgi:glutamyl-tRNA synthetase
VKTVQEMALGSLFFFKAPASYDDKAVHKHVTPDILVKIGTLVDELAQLTEWSATAINDRLKAFALTHEVSLGKLAQPLRIAVCGGTVSPPIDQTLQILGRDEAFKRLQLAMAAWT